MGQSRQWRERFIRALQDIADKFCDALIRDAEKLKKWNRKKRGLRMPWNDEVAKKHKKIDQMNHHCKSPLKKQDPGGWTIAMSVVSLLKEKRQF